ncbi:hypothetical protein KUCAC02_008406 [Chaenocephalus aceratus]|uniref:Uncharacterized protein n=1 Tax=Chaenocephalus aceratus TaxID=36190 RepID=A0ACB9X9Q9_CHAAC|nr:hypothetical protein KUCAC02_008406 [Chaenocephalus aceratus]
MEYGQRYVYVSANREICPDLPYVQRLFHKACREEYGTQTGPTMLAALKLQVEIYNNKCNDTCALSSQGAPLGVVCSPLMKEVHQHCAGGLPLGILLGQSEDEQTIAQGLEQLTQVVGEKGFAGRGHEGPQLVITDDSVWRWLWSKESGVTHGDRPALVAIVKEMLYCQEIGSVDRLYSEARGHPLQPGMRSSSEAAMRVLKDNILQRTKAFNLPQLFDLLTSRMETYYEARIVDVALDAGSIPASKIPPQDGNIAASRIQQIEVKKFVVKGSTPTYDVDMDLELCSCPAGQTGAPCKHRAEVMKHTLQLFVTLFSTDKPRDESRADETDLGRCIDRTSPALQCHW